MYPHTEIAVAIRPAQRSDLDAINQLVEGAVLSWARAAQVKPHTLPDLRFHPVDLDLAMLLVVVGSHRHLLGVAACRSADANTSDCEPNVLRLDGPYVHPAHHQQDIAAQLLSEAQALALRQGRDGLVIEPRLQVATGQARPGNSFNTPATAEANSQPSDTRLA